MPLLKIGNRYINTDLISEWNVLESDGKHVLTLYAVMGASTARFTKDAEIDALLRWLDENSTDIMATADPQPAPVETPRKFKVGDHVVVTRKVIEDDWFWLGRSGRVLNTDGDNGYQVDFDGQSAAMLEEQLTIYDDTVPF